ncbi:Uncharacterised protein [Xylophilus ampelinus]|nr:hypothetical protein [Variovorax sp.]VTY38829.1 Uncharacterised protein [Xylophilus ampelinus]
MRFAALLPAAVLFGTAALAQSPSNWFTVTGDPERVGVDTVQVDPVAVARDADGKTMNIRVNRAALRHNWDGVPYRSYDAQVVFRCAERRAEYRAVTYYMAPLWRGDPHLTVDYADKPRPMLFKDALPNPTERIVRAACGT